MSLNISYFLCLWSKSPLNFVIQPLNSYLGAGMGFACTAMHVCSSPVVYRPPRLILFFVRSYCLFMTVIGTDTTAEVYLISIEVR